MHNQTFRKNENKIVTSNSQEHNDLYNVDMGIAKGTLFKDIYVPYKYDPTPPIPENQEDALMLDIQKYSLAVTDLALYLDIFSDDQEALNLYNKYLGELKKATEKFEKEYGALTLSSSELKNVPWQWDNKNWFGEVK